MSKTFYQFAIFTLILNTIVQFLFVTDHTLNAITTDSTEIEKLIYIVGILYLIQYIFLARYLNFKKLTFPLFISLLGTLVYLLLLSAFILVMKLYLNPGYYDIIYLFHLFINFIYGAGVIKSKVSKTKWLNLVAYLLIIFSSSFIIIKVTQFSGYVSANNLSTIIKTLAFSSFVTPVVYIINYYHELKNIKQFDTEILDEI